MNVNVSEVIGKRLKSDKEIVMYGRFPGSDIKKTLPPGTVSPIINSYLANDNFELVGNENANWYVKNNDSINVVPADSENDSSVFDRVGYLLSDTWENYTRANKKTADRYTDAFTESIDKYVPSAADLGKNLRFVVIGAIAILILLILKNLTD